MIRSSSRRITIGRICACPSLPCLESHYDVAVVYTSTPHIYITGSTIRIPSPSDTSDTSELTSVLRLFCTSHLAHKLPTQHIIPRHKHHRHPKKRDRACSPVRVASALQPAKILDSRETLRLTSIPSNSRIPSRRKVYRPRSRRSREGANSRDGEHDTCSLAYFFDWAELEHDGEAGGEVRA